MSQVAFTVNDTLKANAMQKAKQMGVPLKVILQYCLEAFVDGKISLGINIEPTFKTVDEEIAYYDIIGTRELNKSRKEDGYYESIITDMNKNSQFWKKHITLPTTNS